MFDEIERMSPFLLLLLLLYRAIKNNEWKILIAYIVNNFSNLILKNFIFKPMMKDKKYPIIGKGKRPDGAKNCKIFSDDSYAKSYGMPSGHAQSISFFAVNELYRNKSNKLLVILLSTYLIFSRIKLGCHTTQQVIVGTIFGVVFALLFHYFINNISGKV